MFHFEKDEVTWLSDMKHNSPLDETIRHKYLTTQKNYKKLIKFKKP